MKFIKIFALVVLALLAFFTYFVVGIVYFPLIMFLTLILAAAGVITYMLLQMGKLK